MWDDKLEWFTDEDYDQERLWFERLYDRDFETLPSVKKNPPTRFDTVWSQVSKKYNMRNPEQRLEAFAEIGRILKSKVTDGMEIIRMNDSKLPTLSKQQPSTLPTAQEWNILKDQVGVLLKSGFLPSSIKNENQAVAIAIKGRELGIPPMQAFSHIHIVSGKPTISAELMLALVYRNCPGAAITILQTDDKGCEISAARTASQPQTKFSFTIEDAKKAELLNKDNWRKYPGAMLRARCISIMARAIFPDCLMGASYTPEELGAETDDEGNIVHMQETKGGAFEASPSHNPAETTTPEVYRFPFGPHKGKTLDETFDLHPEHVRWYGERAAAIASGVEPLPKGKDLAEIQQLAKHISLFLKDKN
jgi:hypothetical protein